MFQYPQSGISPLQRKGVHHERNYLSGFSTLSRVLVLCNNFSHHPVPKSVSVSVPSVGY